MLRGFVLGLGALALGGAVIGLFCGAGAAMIGPACIGILLLAGTLFEKHYHGNATTLPGPGWEPTGERFLDPAQGGLVEVWYNKASGERRYVAIRQ